VIALPVSKNEKEDSSGGNLLTGEESSVSEENKTDLEEKLESLLSSVEGVGEVKVLLMTSQKKENESFYGTQETEVTGVLIAATGADNPVTICNIQNAVEALFQIEAHKIKVMKMK
jgi:stage III sporulation protein AG